MASTSNGPKAKKAPAPASRPLGRSGFGAKILSLLREKPLETLGTLGGLAALGTALSAAIGGLGFVALRAREALLGSPSLSYPKQEWLVTGFDALGALFWRGLSVLASDHPVLQRSAWALSLLLLGIVLAAKWKRRPALFLGVFTVSTLLLVVGINFYRFALAATSSPYKGPSRGFDCGERLSANLADSAAFETCSWLMNNAPRNDRRRSDLGGLLGWLLAVCLVAVVAGIRAPVASRRLSRLRWVLVSVHAILGLLLLHDLPRAHAFGTWGLRYPQVQIAGKCDAALAQTTVAGTCRAFDVSAEAEKKMVFLQGPGCPAGSQGAFAPFENDCLITLSSPPEVIPWTE